MNYHSILKKYFKKHPELYNVCVTHSVLVTGLALEIAKKKGLDDASLKFIEEAGMLHDIGIFKVDMPEYENITGEHYLRHTDEGFRILSDEGLPKHARVALTHTGVGISKQEIENKGLSLDKVDHIPVTTEEKIISYADLFYTKSPGKLFKKKTIQEIKDDILKYGDESDLEIFERWHKEYGDN